MNQELKISRDSVYITEMGDKDLSRWPVAHLGEGGNLYAATMPDMCREGLLFNNSNKSTQELQELLARAGYLFMEGPVVDLEAVTRNELVFLEGNDGLWVHMGEEI